MKANRTSAIAELCRTTDATSAEGLRGGSGCSVKRVMVREDLIRRVNPSPVWVACSNIPRGNRFVSGKVLFHSHRNSSVTELHPLNGQRCRGRVIRYTKANVLSSMRVAR